MLGTLKNRVLEGGKQLKSTLEEHSAEMNKQRLQMNINMNSASERLTAVAAAATNVVTTVAKSTTSAAASSASALGTKEPDEVAGGPFFASFVHRQQQVLVGHLALVESGEKLSDVFTKTRRRVTAEAQSAMFLQHNFQNIAQIKDGIRSIRNSIASLVGLMEEVEQLLMSKTEEDLVYTNAAFALQQQAELEQFEHNTLVEKQQRLLHRHNERQRALGDAFAKDLHTYQTIVTYQGHVPVLTVQDASTPAESLETIEMTIQPDEDLETFYKEEDEEAVDQECTPSWHDPANPSAFPDHDQEAKDEGDVVPFVDNDDDETKSDIASTVAELPSEVPTLDGYASDTNEQDD